jgi:glutamate synthase (NADPH/NADH) small chain
VEYPFFASNGIETDKWGGILVDAGRQTTQPGIYAGGDCHRGADLVVTAAYDGREAAQAIIASFLGE